MSCCEQKPNAEAAVKAMVSELPDKTFCCMARMGYTLTKAAFDHFDKGVPAWDELPEDVQEQVGGRVKLLFLGTYEPNTDFEKLWVTVMMTLVTQA